MGLRSRRHLADLRRPGRRDHRGCVHDHRADDGDHRHLRTDVRLADLNQDCRLDRHRRLVAHHADPVVDNHDDLLLENHRARDRRDYDDVSRRPGATTGRGFLAEA